MERARLIQLVAALALSGGLLVETFALFDEDLGTPVPLLHEWTCWGDLDVRATDAEGLPSLSSPTSGLNISARWGDELVPSYFLAFIRRGGGDWEALPPAPDSRGWHAYFVPEVAATTQAYGVARDLSGRRCDGTSSVIRGVPDPDLPPIPPAPTVAPTPAASPESPMDVPPDCDKLEIAVVRDGSTLVATISSNTSALANLTLYVSSGEGFEPGTSVETASRNATFTVGPSIVAAFVHVDFRPHHECAKDSRVVRFTPSP